MLDIFLIDSSSQVSVEPNALSLAAMDVFTDLFNAFKE
jgi:hypothetical protein